MVDADCLLVLLLLFVLFVLSAPCLDLFLRSLTSLLSLLFSSSPHLSSPPEVDPRPRSSVFSSSSPPYTPFSFYSSVLLSLLSFNSACHPPILTLSSLSHPSSILCSPLHSSPVSSLYSLLHSSSFHRSNIALFFLFST